MPKRRDGRRKYNIHDGPLDQNVILQPCPFCGEQHLISIHIMRNHVGEWLLVKCEECGAKKDVHSMFLVQAEVAWNNRPGKMWDAASKSYIDFELEKVFCSHD